jgi:HlyD family type I secretion membrane fusion protein
MKVDFPSASGGTPIPPNLLEKYFGQQLEQRPLDDARKTLRAGAIGAGLFIALLLVLAFLAPISGAAVATGQVTVAGSKLVIQPVQSGVVTEYLVREGQSVRPGQPLVRFNNIRSGAQLRQAMARYDTLRATEARLIAERDGLDRLTFPADLAVRAGDPAAASAMRAETAVFQRRQSVLAAERRINDAQLLSARAGRDGTEQQLALVRDELAGIRELYAKGFARKSTLRALERSEVQLETQSATGLAAIAQAELTSQRTRDSQVMQTVSQLSSVQEQLAQLRPQLDVTRYMADQDVIRAPAAGRVSGVAQIGPGSVVNSGRTLMELVPSGRAYLVEARIKPDDIDDVRVGSVATLRFTSVNPHGRSSFTGKVVTLSPAAVAGPDGTSAYVAQIALDNPEQLARENVVLQPGIPAAVNIKTKDRSLLDYLLAPLGDAFATSFREE